MVASKDNQFFFFFFKQGDENPIFCLQQEGPNEILSKISKGLIFFIWTKQQVDENKKELMTNDEKLWVLDNKDMKLFLHYEIKRDFYSLFILMLILTLNACLEYCLTCRFNNRSGNNYICYKIGFYVYIFYFKNTFIKDKNNFDVL